MKLELRTAAADREALGILKEAAGLDPANIHARFWYGTALLRAAETGSGGLDPSRVALAGLEFEAVFRLSSLLRSGWSQELRRRAIMQLDDCPERLPASEKRFGPWWRKRRAELLSEQPLVDITHVVRPGERLAVIARRYYGDEGEARRILAANPGLDPRKISVGQRLKVPGVPLELPRAVPGLDRVERLLARRLRDGADPAERRVAAARLAGRDCLAAVGELAAALRSDSSPWVRAECSAALGRLGAAGAEPVLVESLGTDPSSQVRAAAARALGRISGRGSVTALLRALSDENPRVAAAAAGSLGKRRVAESSGPLVMLLGSTSELVRRAAVTGLAELAGAKCLASSETERIERLATAGSQRSRSAALLVLSRISPSAAERLLVQALGSPEVLTRRAGCEVAAGLARRGRGLENDAVRILDGMFDSSDVTLQFGSALAVARARRGGDRSARATAVMVRLLGEARPVYWGSARPVPVSSLAFSALKEITGRELPADPAAWQQYLERK